MTLLSKVFQFKIILNRRGKWGQDHPDRKNVGRKGLNFETEWNRNDPAMSMSGTGGPDLNTKSWQKVSHNTLTPPNGKCDPDDVDHLATLLMNYSNHLIEIMPRHTRPLPTNLVSQQGPAAVSQSFWKCLLINSCLLMIISPDQTTRKLLSRVLVLTALGR